MWLSPHRVSPFGHPWIDAYVQLPMAFRSLSRPSSALGAKASSLCFLSLDLLKIILQDESGHLSSSFEIVGSHFFLCLLRLASFRSKFVSLCFSRFVLFDSSSSYAVVRVHGMEGDPPKPYSVRSELHS